MTLRLRTGTSLQIGLRESLPVAQLVVVADVHQELDQSHQRRHVPGMGVGESARLPDRLVKSPALDEPIDEQIEH